MRAAGSLPAPVDEALEVCCGQCSVLVTCRDLAVMALRAVGLLLAQRGRHATRVNQALQT